MSHPPATSHEASSDERPGRGAIIALALVLLHVALAWQLRSPGLAWGEDDAAYLQLAQELRHLSYRDVQ
ncbi:MAG TPA: hypothetical protein VFV33_26160, partial [Gemmatimonadaceae bacterium]|nr:hypothetical protein [Gemmatimonadaceae bacterium]